MIGSAGTSLISYIAITKLIIPYLKKIFRIKKVVEYQNDKEDLEIENISSEIYEKQITFFSNQIEILQKQLDVKQKELDNYSAQLEQLRGLVLTLQSNIFNNNVTINNLKNIICYNLDCKYRNKLNNITDNNIIDNNNNILNK
jgi:hypothetical protein